MLNRNKHHLISNDDKYIFHNKFNDIIHSIKHFNYVKMKYTGSDEDILDFGKPSMFWSNDPVEIIIRHTKKRDCKPLNDKENILLVSIENLKKEKIEEKQYLEISNFSGLSAANDYDYGTIEKYGNSLIPRKEWDESQRHYYGFETDDDYKHLIDELFYSGSINAAILHTWTKRLYFVNSSKSHRLAALYRQDISQNRNTKISFKIYKRELNIEFGKMIFENYTGIITTGSTYSFLAEKLKSIDIKILLEVIHPENDRLYILWVEKSQNELLSDLIEFISSLPSDRCYIISNILEKYLYH